MYRPTWRIDVETTTTGKKGARTSKRQVFVQDGDAWGHYFVASTHPLEGEAVRLYRVDVGVQGSPTCTCPAGEHAFINCRSGACVHVRAARRRHAIRVWPAAATSAEAEAFALHALFARPARRASAQDDAESPF